MKFSILINPGICFFGILLLGLLIAITFFILNVEADSRTSKESSKNTDLSLLKLIWLLNSIYNIFFLKCKIRIRITKTKRASSNKATTTNHIIWTPKTDRGKIDIKTPNLSWEFSHMTVKYKNKGLWEVALMAIGRQQIKI